VAQHDNNTTLAQSKLENSREGFRVKDYLIISFSFSKSVTKANTYWLHIPLKNQ